jgi:hypothetical protein
MHCSKLEYIIFDKKYLFRNSEKNTKIDIYTAAPVMSFIFTYFENAKTDLISDNPSGLCKAGVRVDNNVSLLKKR